MEDSKISLQGKKDSARYAPLKRKTKHTAEIEDFYFLKIGNMWSYFKSQHFSFWMICLYLFFEYFRPQSIYPILDVLPWSQLFILGSFAGAVMDKTVIWVSSAVNRWLIVFAVLIYVSSITAYFPAVSSKFYIYFYSWFIVYFLIINIINTEQRFYIFLLILILCAAKIAIGTSYTFVSRGFGFASWGLMGPPGYFQNSGELAILMLVLFPLAYYIYSFMKEKLGRIERWILLLFWVAPVLTVVGASSRGAQVALALQLLIMFRKKLFKFKSMIILVIFSAALYSILPDEQVERFESSGSDRTSEQRLLYWENGWEMMKDHPLLGVGFFNFAPYYKRYHADDMLYETAQLPHNIFIQVGTDVGFLGLFVFLVLLILPFWLSRKIIRENPGDFLSIAITGILYGIVGFVFAGQFVTVAYYPFLWIALSFAVSGISIFNRKLDHD